jgi:hypothetical protein
MARNIPRVSLVWVETWKDFPLAVGISYHDISWNIKFRGIVPLVVPPDKVNEIPTAFVNPEGASCCP